MTKGGAYDGEISGNGASGGCATDGSEYRKPGPSGHRSDPTSEGRWCTSLRFACRAPMEEAMASRSYGPYRGCLIEVHVTHSKSHALGGISHRFRVSWTVFSPDVPDLRVASFPERFDFLCDQDAFRYGANRAHTFIDSVLSVPSKRPMAGDSAERTAHTLAVRASGTGRNRQRSS
jgi:hypothetical protein